MEAGLRTRDRYHPFPEEMNRHLAGVLTDYHFAPTPFARDNLLAEGIPPESIWLTGNTVIDALKHIADKVNRERVFWEEYLARVHGLTLDGRRLILVTGHRRENFGPGFENICRALRDVAEQCAGVHIVYPVHLNPHVQKPVYDILAAGQAKAPPGQRAACCLETAAGSRVSLLPPLEYAPFVYLLSHSYLVLTDSGGIQEEAPALGKPVLVMREVTERPEGVWAGTVKLVGARRKKIFHAIQKLLHNPASYAAMAQAQNPYGDGLAAARIVQILSGLAQGSGHLDLPLVAARQT